jgi:Dihydropteroate synthase and related enzymes
MAVLNITPDSFSDGGQLFNGAVKMDAVIDQAARL